MNAEKKPRFARKTKWYTIAAAAAAAGATVVDPALLAKAKAFLDILSGLISQGS